MRWTAFSHRSPVFLRFDCIFNFFLKTRSAFASRDQKSGLRSIAIFFNFTQLLPHNVTVHIFHKDQRWYFNRSKKITFSSPLQNIKNKSFKQPQVLSSYTHLVLLLPLLLLALLLLRSWRITAATSSSTAGSSTVAGTLYSVPFAIARIVARNT